MISEGIPFEYVNSKGVVYYLHRHIVERVSGKSTVLYYFSRKQKEENFCNLPDGYVVVEMKTGLPVLKKDAESSD